MKTKIKPILIGLAVVSIVVFIGYALTRPETAPEDPNKPAGSSKVSDKGSNNVYGKADSPVILTEFVDFQCEACLGYYPHVKEVKEKYKDKVKFQIRYFPITSGHKFAMKAAIAAEAAARQDKFFAMHDKLFEGKKTWEQTTDPQKYFDQYAKEIGLNMDKYKKDLENEDVVAVINRDLQDVTELKGEGTPTFLLNGKKIENPGPSVEKLSSLLDQALQGQ